MKPNQRLPMTQGAHRRKAKKKRKIKPVPVIGTRSYAVRVRAITGFLLGGIVEHISSRFSDRQDAEDLLWAYLDINAARYTPAQIQGDIVLSNRLPELYRCCGDLPITIGYTCSGCGRLCDARFIQEQLRTIASRS